MIILFYELQIHYKTIYFDINTTTLYILIQCTVLFYHLLALIYHPVWFVIFFEYLLYFILLLFWFQSSDSISAINSYFRISFQKRISFTLTLSYFGNVSNFCNRHHCGELTTTNSIFWYFVMFVSPPTLMNMSVK